jgi:hypothetical protein
MPPDTGSKPAWETSSRPTGEQISGTLYSNSHPRDKPAYPPGHINPHPAKKKKKKDTKKILNNKQGIEKDTQ